MLCVNEAKAPKLKRVSLGAALAVLCAPLLAGCGGTSLLEQGATVLPPPPTVSLAAITGLPPQQTARLKQRLTAKAREQNISVTDRATPGAYQLSGDFRSGSESLGYEWQLHDQSGGLVMNLPGDDVESAAPQADDTMQRIADKTSTSVAYRLASLGYAARVPSLVRPPQEYFDRANKGAALEIDQETLNGPPIAQADAALPMPGVIAALQPSPDVAPEETPAPAAAAADKASEESSVTVDKGSVIRAVAVVPVKGAPGSGNKELTEAMRTTLRKAGWAVIETPRADALTVVGEVGVARADAGKQRVAVRWIVATNDGKSLGDVKQANAVPAGSLDQSWGPAATEVAEAAAGGIFDLVGKYR